jgi:hypothetical protein
MHDNKNPKVLIFAISSPQSSGMIPGQQTWSKASSIVSMPSTAFLN